MNGKLESTLNLALTVSALALATVAVRNAVRPQRGGFGYRSPGEAPPTYYKEWHELLDKGIYLGTTEAQVQIVEFVDFECPVCRSFHQGALRDAIQRFGAKVGVTLVHMPLRIHRFAPISARAVECAYRQGVTAAFIDRMFEAQDSVGLKGWGSFASAAEIPDTTQFVRCVSEQAPIGRIDSGLAVARRLEIGGTPTVFINGWRLGAPPSSETLTQAIQDILDGREPFRSPKS